MDYDDIVKNLFTDKHSDKVKKECLAELQNNRKLPDYIEKYHKKYLMRSGDVAVFHLAKDLGFFDVSVEYKNR